MTLAIDLLNYLVGMQGLAQLHADLARENLAPQVKWGRLAVRTKRLRERVEDSIERKRREKEEA